MRLLRKLVALVVYAALLFPGTDQLRLTAWMRAVEITSTALDRTLRRRRSKVETANLARHQELLKLDVQYEERTLRVRRARCA